MRQILDFLKRLAADNNREWFTAHKDEYLDVKRRTEEIAEHLIAAVATVDTEAVRLSAADCTYRIYRDTRFSADKTPYKTHVGIFVNPPFGKKSLTCGYYLHLEPENVFFAAGTVCLPSKIVTAIRLSIRENTDDYLRIIRSPGFAALFTTVGENPVKTAPKGFDRSWEHIDLVRPRDFVATAPLDLRTLPDAPAELAEYLLPYIREAARFNGFMNCTIEDFI